MIIIIIIIIIIIMCNRPRSMYHFSYMAPRLSEQYFLSTCVCLSLLWEFRLFTPYIFSYFYPIVEHADSKKTGR